MAKSKAQIAKLKAHFFMSIGDGTVHTLYDDNDDKTILAAGFASAMMENTYLYDVISTAFLVLLEDKEKYSSKKSNDVPKTVKKVAKKK
jgi:hypothetical protein